VYAYVSGDPLASVDPDGRARRNGPKNGPPVVSCVGINQSCGAPVRPPGINPEYPNVCYQCLMRLKKWPYGPEPDCDE
jgi:hypothetical protein